MQISRMLATDGDSTKTKEATLKDATAKLTKDAASTIVGNLTQQLNMY